MQEVKVKHLAQRFMWEIVTGDSESLERIITLPDTNRPGLELAGYFPDSQTKRLVILGEKEIGYIEEEMDEISQRRSFEFLTSDNTPCIIVAHGYECPAILKEISERKNFPVFKTPNRTTDVVVGVTNYLDERLAESVILHGELVRIHGVGVLITGKSGMGKSEIALELIKRGHQLVADDRVDCYAMHNTLIGKTTPLLEGFMEFRGVGIINVGRMFGVGAYANQTEIELQIDLEPYDSDANYDRVGIEEKEFSEILGVKIMRIRIPVSSGRPMSTIIETAVINYLLLKKGWDSAKEFEERVLAQISINKKENEK